MPVVDRHLGEQLQQQARAPRRGGRRWGSVSALEGEDAQRGARGVCAAEGRVAVVRGEERGEERLERGLSHRRRACEQLGQLVAAHLGARMLDRALQAQLGRTVGLGRADQVSNGAPEREGRGRGQLGRLRGQLGLLLGLVPAAAEHQVGAQVAREQLHLVQRAEGLHHGQPVMRAREGRRARVRGREERAAREQALFTQPLRGARGGRRLVDRCVPVGSRGSGRCRAGRCLGGRCRAGRGGGGRGLGGGGGGGGGSGGSVDVGGGGGAQARGDAERAQDRLHHGLKPVDRREPRTSTVAFEGRGHRIAGVGAREHCA